jgi:hypothetical protein
VAREYRRRMTVPNTRELLHWADQYVALWNAGDKDAWIANWRSVAPGELTMYDPVGTPPKHGFEHCCTDSWDLFQGKVKFRIQPGALFVNGDDEANEVAWLLENHMSLDGNEVVALSVETYRFGADGSCLIRTYYRVPPARTDGDLGEMFDAYLPDR